MKFPVYVKDNSNVIGQSFLQKYKVSSILRNLLLKFNRHNLKKKNNVISSHAK